VPPGTAGPRWASLWPWSVARAPGLTRSRSSKPTSGSLLATAYSRSALIYWEVLTAFELSGVWPTGRADGHLRDPGGERDVGQAQQALAVAGLELGRQVVDGGYSATT
jgi:hypothetical protein